MKNNEINWEERRWELLTKMCGAREGASYGQTAAQSIGRLLQEVDTIIEEYKKRLN